ncbi:hypothetical protein PHMEG_00014901 [Phytophthora megakarya]|uniref:Uncharacterized protein n=1 Tax=Phytophthora megakarya TaxID=4795 RepID=A0A225W347_9STRA|nr:hypothetical protein PHMEG_00014901 [Phytophthora megakarya]
MAGKKKNAQEAGRDDMGRGEATRSSRRVQGLFLPKQKSIEEVERDHRKKNAATNAAKRRVAEEEKPTAQDETAPESFVRNDAHQVSPDGEGDRPEESHVDDSALSGSVLSPDGKGESVLEGPVQTSVGGVVKVDPPVGDRVLDSLQPDEEVEVLEMMSAVEEERPLVTVVEDEVLEVSSPSPRPEVPSGLEEKMGAADRTESRDSVRTEVLVSGTSGTDEAGSRMRTYVADQVRRWVEVPSGRTLPPNVKFAWVNGVPDSKFFHDAAVDTSKYLLQRSSMASQAEAWISELRPKRNKFGMARDLAGLMVPIGELSSLEATAILQTLLAEAGFELHNLIPGWLRTRTANVDSDLVRTVATEVQQLLEVELIEWRQLISEGQCHILFEGETDEMGVELGQPSPEGESDDMHAEDRDVALNYWDAALSIKFVCPGSESREPQRVRPLVSPVRNVCNIIRLVRSSHRSRQHLLWNRFQRPKPQAEV